MHRILRAALAVTLVTVLSAIGAVRPAAGQGSKTVEAQLDPATARRAAPDFALPDENGKVVKLSDYRGKVVLLDFWATTCGGCVEEIPMFIEIAEANKQAGLATIGVSEDVAYAQLSGSAEAWARVKPFVREHNVSYPVVVGDERVTAAYGIKALPLTYLLDKQGRIAATYLGVVNRDSLLANLRALLSE